MIVNLKLEMEDWWCNPILMGEADVTEWNVTSDHTDRIVMKIKDGTIIRFDDIERAKMEFSSSSIPSFTIKTDKIYLDGVLVNQNKLLREKEKMDWKEIKKKQIERKRKLSEDIATLLQEYSNETGFVVNSIDIDTQSYMNFSGLESEKPSTIYTSVNVSVNIFLD